MDPEMAGDEGRGSSSAHLRITTRGDVIVIDVEGILDETAARVLGEAALGAVDCDCARVRVELGHVDGFTAAGAAAFAGVQSRFPLAAGGRVTYHADSLAGQAALLASYPHTR